MVVKKQYRYSKIIRKTVGILCIAVLLYLAFKSINHFRNFLGVFLSMNCIVLANALVKVFLPEEVVKSENETDLGPRRLQDFRATH